MRLGNLKIAIGARRRGVSAIDKLITSLNPIFWIKDTTVVVDGYFVDSSGHNKQIAVTTVVEVNDTITMPANDTDIINAVKADGSYNYFYTNDATPKSVRLGELNLFGSRRFYSFFYKSHFCLLPSTPSQIVQEELYSLLSICKAYLPNVNLIKGLNFQKQENPNAIIVGTAFPAYFYLNGASSYADEVQDFLESDKEIVTPITAPVTTNAVNVISEFVVGGKFKISFWVNVSDLDAGSRNFSILVYLHSMSISKSTGITKSNLTTLDYTTTAYSGLEYEWTVTVKDVQGVWSRVELAFVNVIPSDGNINPAAFGTIRISIGLTSGTPVLQDVHHADVVLTKDYSGEITSGDLMDGSYDKLSSNIFGKTLCAIGDSITLGGRYLRIIQNNYGLSQIYNTAVSGRSATRDGDGNDIYQDRETIAAQDCDIYTVLLGANDCNDDIGEIGGSVDTYLGGYDEFLGYITTNLPGKQIVLITSPFVVKPGNTIAEGKALYEQKFIDFATGVKALGVKYDLPVCDLHSLMPMTFENSAIYLLDKVHWTYVMHVAAGDIIGKFINDLYA